MDLRKLQRDETFSLYVEPNVINPLPTLLNRAAGHLSVTNKLLTYLLPTPAATLETRFSGASRNFSLPDADRKSYLLSQIKDSSEG
jgi:hypothetical protein